MENVPSPSSAYRLPDIKAQCNLSPGKEGLCKSNGQLMDRIVWRSFCGMRRAAPKEHVIGDASLMDQAREYFNAALCTGQIKLQSLLPGQPCVQ